MTNKTNTLLVFSIVNLIGVICLIVLVVCAHNFIVAEKPQSDELLTSTDETGKYYEYHPNYRIVDISKETAHSEFYYEIKSGNEILSQGTHNGIVKIANLENNLIRLLLDCGSNCRYIQYFNVYTNEISESFLVPSAYADYSDESGNYLFAYFDYTESGQDTTVLKIRDVFDVGFSTEIKREFISPVTGANMLIFLNEKDIYIDYDVFIDEPVFERETIREIVSFR